jgi:hypothetical protein
MIATLLVAASIRLAAGALPDRPAAPEALETPGTGPAGLKITLLPGVWMPRLDGCVSLGPGNSSIELALDLDLDAWEPTFNGELTIAKGDLFEIFLEAAIFSTSTEGTFGGSATFGPVVLDPGDPYSASFDLTSVAVELDINVFRPVTRDPARAAAASNLRADGGHVADLRFSPLVGLRYADVDQVVESGGVSARAGGEWASIYGGLQITLDCRPEARLPMVDSFRMQAALGIGPALGGDGGFMWTVRGGLTVQITRSIGIVVGYRLLELDVENDDYELQGGLQGLFFAASLRF